jgi:hypothetical protein
MDTSGIGHNSRSQLRTVSKFVFHQIVSTFGIAIVAAPYFTAVIFGLVRLFGPVYSVKSFHVLLTELPYFPLQIAWGLVLGWLLSRLMHHRIMLWVWIIPFVLLCCAFVALPTLAPDLTPPRFQAGIGESRISHYFGRGCSPRNHCLDQLLIVMPFYASAAYSLGAFLQRRFSSKRVSLEEGAGDTSLTG